MTDTCLIGGSGISIFVTPLGVLTHFLTPITIKDSILRIRVAFLSDVGTGINTCLLPWVSVDYFTLSSAATCLMWGTITPSLAITVTATTVSANLRNVTVLPQI